MRRWWPVAVALCGLLVAGCGRPPGVDGSLTNNWPPFPSATFTPAAIGACYEGESNIAGTRYLSAAFLGQVDCAGTHLTETVYAGQFTGPAAAPGSPPDASSPAGRQAYARCAAAASAYLGGDFRTAQVALAYLPASQGQWTAGDRYYRCDLVQETGPAQVLVKRTGSVRDGLRGARPLAFTCGVVDYASGAPGDAHRQVNDIKATGCREWHDAEFVGLYQVTDSAYPSSSRWQTITDTACVKLVPAFLGGGAAWAVHQELGCEVWYPGTYRWGMGDRALTCWVILNNGRTIRGSLRDIGSGPLPY